MMVTTLYWRQFQDDGDNHCFGDLFSYADNRSPILLNRYSHLKLFTNILHQRSPNLTVRTTESVDSRAKLEPS